jgi:hypothetical protein
MWWHTCKKPDFVFRRNGRVHLNRRGRQFSRLLPAEVCASAIVMLDTPCSEVVWRVLATHSICQFPLHFSRALPCAITFQLDSNKGREGRKKRMRDWGTKEAVYNITECVYLYFLKFTLKQATKTQTGSSSTLSSTSALDGVGGQRHVPAALPLGGDPLPIV